MAAHPQTIQIFLPAGDPQGIRIAEFPTRIMSLIEVPRSLLGDFMKMSQSEQVGLYFLFGEEEDGLQKAYIGQSGTLGMRLAQHHSRKDFWNRALIAVSRTNDLTDTHAKYLEWLSIQQAQQAGRYQLDNGNAGGRPHTPAPLLADCAEIHDTLRVLLATLGYPLFEPLARWKPPASESETSPADSATLNRDDAQARIYYLRGSEANGRGLYTKEGFVVLAGSTGRSEVVPSFELHGYHRLRQQLLQQGILITDGGRIRFERDHLFKAPSAAAACLMGRTANGPLEWRDAQGRSLWDLEMAPLEAKA